MSGALMTKPHPTPHPTQRTSSREPGVPAWILRVRKLMAEKGWTNAEFSKRSGMSRGWVTTTITQAERGAQPRRDTLTRMAQTFNEPIGLWLKLGGLAPEDHEWDEARPTFAEFVDSDPSLTDDQRNVLKSLYLSYVPVETRRTAPATHRRRRSV